MVHFLDQICNLATPYSALPELLFFVVPAGCIVWWAKRPTALTALSALFLVAAVWTFPLGACFSFFMRDGLGLDSVETTGIEACKKVLPELMAVVRLTARLLDIGIWLALLSFVPWKPIRERWPFPMRMTRLGSWSLVGAIAAALWLGFGPLELLLFHYRPSWVAVHRGAGATLTGALLQGTDLSSADLSAADLRDADLAGANLRGARLPDAKMRGADLIEADLCGATLTGADLQWADLTASNLYRAHFGAVNLDRANLVRSQMSGIDLNRAWLIEAQLQNARLVGAHLNGSDLRAADLSGANLSNTDFSYTNLRGANLATAMLATAKLTGAAYDRHTRWPPGFNPNQHGAIWMECARWRDGGSCH